MKKNNFFIICPMFYIAVLLVAVFSNDEFGFFDKLQVLFATSASNYLVYAIPVIAAVFLKKKKTASDNNTIYYSILLLLLLLLLFCEPNYRYDAKLLTFISITSLMLIMININTPAAYLILIPNLFINQLGMGYIITSYIPTGLLLFASYTSKKTTDEKKRSVPETILPFTYLYFVILMAFLIIRKKSNLNTDFIFPQVNYIYEYISIIAGFILVLLLSALFLTKVLRTITNKTFLSILPWILYSLYPLLFAFLGLFTTAISVNIKSTLISALILIVFGNIQLDISFRTQNIPLLPIKKNNNLLVLSLVALFYALCFTHN